MKKMKILLFLALTLLMTNSFAGNCVFRPEKDCIDRLKIYIDRQGDIYPSSDLYSFNQGLFFNPPRDGNDNTSKLSIYFKNDPSSCGAICESFGVPSDFVSMQQYLLKSYGARINQAVQNGKKIVFLIHGFNNSQKEADSSFKILKSQLNKYNDIAIVEVYWDGLTKAPLRIWSKAQPNSVYAGLAIRKLLNEVDHNADIMLLTHSLGASVATHALFNVSKWRVEFQPEVDRLSNLTPTPAQKSITLSMIAPAIPGVNTFEDITKTVVNNTTTNIRKIIVGYNHRDFALTKVIGMKKYFGSTSLGCNAEDEVFKTGKILASIAPNITFAPFNLSKKPKPSEHSVSEYVKADLFEKFLNEAFIN